MLEGNYTTTESVDFMLILAGKTTSFLYGMATIRCIIIMLGIPGNILILLTTLSCRKLRTVTNILTIQIAISNLLQCGLNLPYSLYLFLNADHQHSVAACLFMAHLLVIEMLTTILVFAVVAINRYVLVVSGRIACSRVFTRRNTAVVIVLTWCWSILLSFLPYVGLGKLGFNHLLMDCAFVIEDWNTYLYLVVLSATTLLPCLLSTGICYAKIGMLLWKVSSKVQDVTNAAIKTPAEVNRKTKTLRTVFALMVIFLVYLTVWTPFGVIIIGDRHSKWHPTVYTLVSHSILAQNAIFPMIYMVVNKNHREAHWLAIKGQWQKLRELQ